MPPPFYLVGVSFNMQQKEPLIRLRVCWGSEVSPSWSQLVPSVFFDSLCVASFLFFAPFNLNIYVLSC